MKVFMSCWVEMNCRSEAGLLQCPLLYLVWDLWVQPSLYRETVTKIET